jgi:hypothetical protein
MIPSEWKMGKEMNSFSNPKFLKMGLLNPLFRRALRG